MSSARALALPALFVLTLPLTGAGAEDDAPAKPSFGEEVVVIGPRRRTAAADPTAAATVVDASRFAGEAKSVAELVATAPGVAVNQYGGLGQLATVSIRGSNADQVQVFLDGLPLNTAAGGGVDLSRIPRAWIERIEIVRGAEGAYYGSGALGGVLNIVTRSPTSAGWAVEASGASFRTGSAMAEVASGAERWGALAALSADGTGGEYPYDFDATPNTPGGTRTVIRANNAAFSGAALSKLWARLGDGRFDGALQLSAGRREIPGNAFAFTRDDQQRDARAGAVLRYARPLSEFLRVSLQATARSDRLDVSAQSVGGTARQRDLASSATARLDWLTGAHALTASLTGGGDRLAADGTGTRSRPELALSLTDELDLLGGRLRTAPALRAERLGRFSGLSGKLGTALHVSGPLSARASAGRSFRAPSFAELYLQQGFVAPNPGLTPEEAWSFDAALALNGRLGVASAGAFATRYRDVIIYLPASFQRVKPFNAGEAAARGIEVEVATAPLGAAGISGQIAYTLLATETLRGGSADVGRELPHRARHRAFARLGVAPGPLEAHAEVHYVGAQWEDARNLAAIPAAWVVNTGASARILSHPDVRVNLELRNLLDDRALTDGFQNPLPGRMVMVTLRVAGGKEVP